jgi:hypothetical protein
MGTLSDHATEELVDHVFKAAYAPLDTLHLCLLTALPAVDATGSNIVETDYANYVRKAIGVADFDAAAARKIIQTRDIAFAQAGGVSTSDISHWAIVDLSANGNMLAFGAFDTPWNVVDGNTPTIPDLEIEISIGASSAAGFTTIAANLMLDLMFREVAWTSPNATIHFGLATTIIVDGDGIGDVAECSGGSYERIAVPSTSMNAASAGVADNGVAITFITPTGSWGTVTSMFVVNDASGTGGDLLAFDNGNIVDQEPTTEDTVRFIIGAFDVDLD